MTVNNDAEHELADANEITFFAPLRPTVVQALRPGDELLVPTNDGDRRGRITDIRDDEETRTITVNGDLIGESGLFEKPAHPGEVLQRLVQPGEPLPGTESILVHGDNLWKWIGATMDDPYGSAEQFILRTWQRVHDDEIDGEAIEVRLQSVWNPKKTITQTALLDSTVGFRGYR
ncbi:hypothetical protein EB75_02380 [Mycobacterium sp. ST-F2]|uniref:hypothetical protein n=1 Tax=Mycobacterium sp. ST-F2 TaxID=1490484 RepID=UPI00093A0018|nr:hypothetical protein [Mycobacterium sp. ST-F2]OKH85008.1 hypothetical protein EB75_02380 [Mycobacterium sp. ST-F2]